MPLYEYACDKCADVFEITQKFSDPPLSACPKCASPVRKLVSRTSFQLKGGGWYVSDYKKKAAPAEASPSESKPKEPPKGGGGGCSGACH